MHNPNDPLDRYRSAMAVQLGQMHNEKYYTYDDVDIKRLELRNLAETADYSGMSDTEKFMTIYDRYNQAFRGFWTSSAIWYPSLGNTAVDLIQRDFTSELTAVFGSMEKATDAYRAAQYGNMSDSEIRETIAAKYPPLGKITLREFSYMVDEMSQVGVDEKLRYILGEAMVNSGLGDIMVREELLDKPIDIQMLCKQYNTMRNAIAKTISNDVGNSGAVMRELFGVNYDSYGNVYTNNKSPVNYSLLIKQFTEKYQRWTAADYERWVTVHI